jgi:hypothetical protein
MGDPSAEGPASCAERATRSTRRGASPWRTSRDFPGPRGARRSRATRGYRRRVRSTSSRRRVVRQATADGILARLDRQRCESRRRTLAHREADDPSEGHEPAVGLAARRDVPHDQVGRIHAPEEVAVPVEERANGLRSASVLEVSSGDASAPAWYTVPVSSSKVAVHPRPSPLHETLQARPDRRALGWSRRSGRRERARCRRSRRCCWRSGTRACASPIEQGPSARILQEPKGSLRVSPPTPSARWLNTARPLPAPAARATAPCRHCTRGSRCRRRGPTLRTGRDRTGRTPRQSGAGSERRCWLMRSTQRIAHDGPTADHEVIDLCLRRAARRTARARAVALGPAAISTVRGGVTSARSVSDQGSRARASPPARTSCPARPRRRRSRAPSTPRRRDRGRPSRPHLRRMPFPRSTCAASRARGGGSAW